MIKRIVITIVFICACIISQAQVNLVKNPSLELHTGCPSTFDQISLATYWNSLDTIYNTDSIALYGQCAPEYCNVCATWDALGVPNGASYYQYPRTGNGMTQVQIFYDESIPTYPNHRDYLQGRLYHNLTAGKSYCVTYYVNLEEGSGFATNNIEAYLDDGTIDTFGYYCGQAHTTVVPQITEDSIISDTMNWVKVQGSFTANGTERFITIGNFHDKAHTNYSAVTAPFGAGNHFTWYLIDDISVIASDAVADAGPDVSVAPGDSVWIGVDSNGDGMPCYWYVAGGTVAVDSGGRVLVHPDTTTSYIVAMDLCGNVTRDTVTVHVWPLGVGGVQAAGGSVQVWPNPAGSELTISAGEQIRSVVVSNVVGQVVSSQFYNAPKVSVDVSGLLPGTYFVKVNDIFVRKFVKQ